MSKTTQDEHPILSASYKKITAIGQSALRDPNQQKNWSRSTSRSWNSLHLILTHKLFILLFPPSSKNIKPQYKKEKVLFRCQ